ncbi:hypothetical protein L7F22_057456 [Adiantum nelumboides]|nr:hypothetical protein [Adiantum nelumboides]
MKKACNFSNSSWNNPVWDKPLTFPWVSPTCRPDRPCPVLVRKLKWSSSRLWRSYFCTEARVISILVVNCSLFTPIPSLASMIINKFKLRSDVKSFNLSGMGCSASVISLSLAQNLLRVHRNSYALIVSTENITQNWYCGNRRSMMIPNCLFRIGSAAILLSSKHQDVARSKYKLKHVMRTLTGANDQSFKCVYQEQDEEGNCGITLSRDLTKVAGEALKVNITNLGPLVLPLSEQLAYVCAEIRRRIQADPKSKPYIPDFIKAFDHFCIHAGGRAVIDELEKSLKLQPQHVEASIWYELAYLEAKGKIKARHKVSQIALVSQVRDGIVSVTTLTCEERETRRVSFADELQYAQEIEQLAVQDVLVEFAEAKVERTCSSET